MEQQSDVWSSQQLLQEQPDQIDSEKPISFVGEWGRMPVRIIGAEAPRPVEQQLIVMLHEKAFKSKAELLERSRH